MIAVDLQQKMLDVTVRRAGKAGVVRLIRPRSLPVHDTEQPPGAISWQSSFPCPRKIPRRG